MNRTAALVASAALAVAAAFLLHRGLTRESTARAAAEEPLPVVAAERDIPAGVPLSREDLMPLEIPRRALAPSTITAEHGPSLFGQTLLRPRRKGEQLSWFDIAEHGRGLAEAIPPGERAVTVAVDERSGLSGMLKPNDHVDVLYLEIRDEEGGGGKGRSGARLLLPDVTVLATGTRTGLDAPAEETPYGTVTLACLPEEAAAVALAQARGELVFLLRNPADRRPAEPWTVEERDLGGDLARRREQRIEILHRGGKP